MARKKAEEKIVKLILLKEGIYDLEEMLTIKCPISIRGAGQDNTILQRHGIQILGTQEEGKRVNMQGLTMKSSEDGLYASNGLSFLCKEMTFTQCGDGVCVSNTKGRLINCVITQCRENGIWCDDDTLIVLEGDQTKVDGNGTLGVDDGLDADYGLSTSYRSSIIHLLFPLTQESVSTNHYGGRNYGGEGEIAIVDDDGYRIEYVDVYRCRDEEYSSDLYN